MTTVKVKMKENSGKVAIHMLYIYYLRNYKLKLHNFTTRQQKINTL